jgi:hypothetical protein
MSTDVQTVGTLAPTSPPSDKKKWEIAGGVILGVGIIVFIFASLAVVNSGSEVHLGSVGAFWLGMICIVIGSALLQHSSLVA